MIFTNKWSFYMYFGSCLYTLNQSVERHVELVSFPAGSSVGLSRSVVLADHVFELFVFCCVVKCMKS